MRGTCKVFYINKGYGFLVGPDDRDIFCHVRDLVLEPFLTSGDVVEFEVQETPKGLKAIQVRKIEST